MEPGFKCDDIMTVRQLRKVISSPRYGTEF